MYLEHVAEDITDWTKEQEANYEAEILAKEVIAIQKEIDTASSRPPSAKDKKGAARAKSPRKSPSNHRGLMAIVR